MTNRSGHPATVKISRGTSPALKESAGHPPISRLVLHIGVTGHRPPRLSPDQFAVVKEAAGRVLVEIQKILIQISRQTRGTFTDKPPLIRLISSVAEGADSLLAQAALNLGLELQCPLPFPRVEYEQDFKTAESLVEYHRLLDSATTVLELDGNRIDEGSAYLNAGTVMLDQSDLVIAVWDGAGPARSGGTAEIVAEAQLRDIPVLCIPPRDPASMRLLGKHAASAWQDLLRTWMEEFVKCHPPLKTPGVFAR